MVHIRFAIPASPHLVPITFNAFELSLSGSIPKVFISKEILNFSIYNLVCIYTNIILSIVFLQAINLHYVSFSTTFHVLLRHINCGEGSFL